MFKELAVQATGPESYIKTKVIFVKDFIFEEDVACASLVPMQESARAVYGTLAKPTLKQPPWGLLFKEWKDRARDPSTANAWIVRYMVANQWGGGIHHHR